MADQKTQEEAAAKVEDTIDEEKVQAEPKRIKSEEEILFPDITIHGFTIRPWTLGKLMKINPHLEKIFSTLEAKHVNVSLDQMNVSIKDLYFAAIPEVISILAISLDKNEKELEDLPIPQAITLAYAVYKQNEEAIKNVLSLLQVARS